MCLACNSFVDPQAVIHSQALSRHRSDSEHLIWRFLGWLLAIGEVLKDAIPPPDHIHLRKIFVPTLTRLGVYEEPRGTIIFEANA